MSKMIERVAKAIVAHIDSVDEFEPHTVARAAIAAMRDLPQSFQDVAWPKSFLDTFDNIGTGDLMGAHRAMIDAALSEQISEAVHLELEARERHEQAHYGKFDPHKPPT